MAKLTSKLEATSFSRGSGKWIALTLVEAALFIVAGILTICFYQKTFDVMFPAIGSLLIVIGIIRVLLGFIPVLLARDKDAEGRKKVRERIRYGMLVAAGIFLALGIGLIILYCTGNKLGITQFLETAITLIATIFITIGALALLFGIALLIGKVERTMMSVAIMVVGLAAIAGGIVLFIYNDQSGVILQALTIIIGVLVAGVGVYLAYDAFAALYSKNKRK